MKKMAAMVAVVALVVVCAGWDQVTRSIYELVVHELRADSAAVGALTVTTVGGTAQATVLAGAAAGATALQPATFAQVNTNVTANPAIYAPAFVGQVQIGTVSNVLWVAKGTTTNDWVATK
jgi:hypothetical protein